MTANHGPFAAASTTGSPGDGVAGGCGKVERPIAWLEAKAVLAEWCRRHWRQP
jgi:hypothetical protein